MRSQLRWSLVAAVAFMPIVGGAHEIPSAEAIDAKVRSVMAKTHAEGLAMAVIDRGQPRYVQAYGVRNGKGEPLTVDTVMYGASLTKRVFAYTVMQLVERGASSHVPF